MGQDILYNNVNFPDRAASNSTRKCGSARTLHVVWRRDSARVASTLREVAVVVVPRLSDARGGCGSARTMHAQREVQLALRNNYYINRAPQILFI